MFEFGDGGTHPGSTALPRVPDGRGRKGSTCKLALKPKYLGLER